jgi:hypothetical protein
MESPRLALSLFNHEHFGCKFLLSVAVSLEQSSVIAFKCGFESAPSIKLQQPQLCNLRTRGQEGSEEDCPPGRKKPAALVTLMFWVPQGFRFTVTSS